VVQVEFGWESGPGVEQAQKSGTPSSSRLGKHKHWWVRESVVMVTAGNVSKSEGERKHEASLCL
jgi:hypothetical protein